MIEPTTVGCPFDGRCDWTETFVDIPTLDRQLADHKIAHAPKVRHDIYPHAFGTLYDCEACEAECFCGNRTPPGVNPACCNLPAMLPGTCHTECIHCALAQSDRVDISDGVATITYRDGSGRTATAYVPPF